MPPPSFSPDPVAALGGRFDDPDTVADGSLWGLDKDPGVIDPEALDGVLDEFGNAEQEDGDEEIEGFLAKVTSGHGGGHREMLSALSALSQQMERYRPLSVPEQVSCMLTYNAGLEARAALTTRRRLSARKRAELERVARVGDDAQMELVGSMFRLVLVIARELASNRYGRERSLDMLSDLVADANLALVEAVAGFDPGRGPAFNMYAGRVIRERIRGALTKVSPLGIPASWLRVKRLATTLAPELAAGLGRQPTVEEMQAALRVQCLRWAGNRLTDAQGKLPEDERLALMEQKLVKQGMFGAIDRYEEVMVATRQIDSIDAPIGDADGARYSEILSETDSGDTFDSLELGQLREALMAALASIPDRDREIVLYRFGFMDGEVWTYARLAPQYNISAERVRQIERNVLGKMRGPGFDALGGFLPSSMD